MKSIITIVLLLFGFFCSAQNYNCFVPGKRQYFINSNNYLRGIRIDSVVANGTDTIYYPFHTPRGYYSYDPSNINSDSTYYLDSTGGSWVGKQVIKQQDGTFLFDNIWGDTVIIETQAHIGDTWTFYNDSNRYYMATVTGTDTMMIEGNVDSVKTMSITAYMNGTINNSDSVNNTKITLSRQNGFVQVCDLYIFPFHTPAKGSYQYNYDYYSDYIMSRSSNAIEIFSFHQIAFIDAILPQIYDWNINDVYEYFENPYNPLIGGYTPNVYYTDTIKNKMITSTGVQYMTNGWIGPLNYTTFYPFNFFKNATSRTFNIPNTFIIDTLLMPEEYRQPNFYYYYPDDTTFCNDNVLYNIIPQRYLSCNKYLNDPYGINLISNTYKIGMGKICYSANFNNGDFAGYMDTSLIYSSKSSQECGTYYSNVSIIKSNNDISLFPNPATSNLNISFPNTNHINYSVSLINTLGQAIRTTTTSEEKTTISVGDIPNGLYDVMIVSADGERVNEKVIVDH